MKGFTLVELLVAMTLGAIISAALLGVFLAFLQSQIHGQDERSALETIRFSIDDISRDLYFGRDYTCAAVAGQNTPAPVNDLKFCNCLSFIDQLERQIKVRLKNKVIEKRVSPLNVDPSNCNQNVGWSPISSRSVEVSNLLFSFSNSSTGQDWVGVSISSKYSIANEVEKILNTNARITRRILEPSQNIASKFNIGSRIASLETLKYFGNVNSTKCVDEDGVKINSSEYNPCSQKLYPISVEFTPKGHLFIITDNGLVFLILKENVDKLLLSSTPKTIHNAVNVRGFAKLIQGGSVTKGTGSDRKTLPGIFNDHTPKNISKIYVKDGSNVYAESSAGALYLIKIKDNGTFSVKRQLKGRGFGGYVELFTPSDTNTVALFRNEDLDQKFILYSGIADLSSSDGSSINDSNAILGQKLEELSTTSIENIQYLDSYFNVWHSGNSFFKIKKSTNSVSIETLSDSSPRLSYPLVSITDPNGFVSRCNKGNSARISSICFFKKDKRNSNSIEINDKYITLSAGTEVLSSIANLGERILLSLSSEGEIHFGKTDHFKPGINMSNLLKLNKVYSYTGLPGDRVEGDGLFCDVTGLSRDLYSYFSFFQISTSSYSNSIAGIGQLENSNSEGTFPEIFFVKINNDKTVKEENTCGAESPTEYYNLRDSQESNTNFQLVRLPRIFFKV